MWLKLALIILKSFLLNSGSNEWVWKSKACLHFAKLTNLSSESEHVYLNVKRGIYVIYNICFLKFCLIIRQNARRACKNLCPLYVLAKGWNYCFFLHMTMLTVSQIHQSHPEVAEERDSCRAWQTSWHSSEPCWPLGSQTVDPGHCTWHCCTQTPERQGENWNWSTNQLPRH